MSDEIVLRCNENGEWEKYEPYATVECPTEEDYNLLVRALEHYRETENGKPVEIVHCKNCKHWREMAGGELRLGECHAVYKDMFPFHPEFAPITEGMEFCAWGDERRPTNETETHRKALKGGGEE